MRSMYLIYIVSWYLYIAFSTILGELHLKFTMLTFIYVLRANSLYLIAPIYFEDVLSDRWAGQVGAAINANTDITAPFCRRLPFP